MLLNKLCNLLALYFNPETLLGFRTIDWELEHSHSFVSFFFHFFSIFRLSINHIPQSASTSSSSLLHFICQISCSAFSCMHSFPCERFNFFPHWCSNIYCFDTIDSTKIFMRFFFPENFWYESLCSAWITIFQQLCHHAIWMVFKSFKKLKISNYWNILCSWASTAAIH